MKKIFRFCFRIILVLSMAIFTVISFVKISDNKDIPALLGIIIYILLLSITIVMGILLLSHPMVKLSFRKKVKIKKSEKTLEFEQICNSLMTEYGSFLESFRKKGIFFITLIIIGLIIVFLISLLKLNFNVLIILGIILIVPPVTLYVNNKIKFKYAFKKLIMPASIRYIEPKLQYYPDGSEDMITKYNSIFPDDEDYNGIESTDYIYGKMNNIPLEICKISLVNYSEKTGENINTIQTLLFTHNKINFSIPNILKITPNNLFYSYNKNRVEMDSKEFEKYFDIFSNSEILAMQILTHDVMEELIYFHLKFDCNFEIIIENNDIFITFKTGDIFNPKIFTNVTDSDFLWTYYTILNFITNLCVKINKSLEETEI